MRNGDERWPDAASRTVPFTGRRSGSVSAPGRASAESVEAVARGLRAPAMPPRTGGFLGAISAAAALGLVTLGLAVAGTRSPAPVDEALRDAAGDGSPQLYETALAVDFLGEPLGVVLVATLLSAACLVLGRWRLAVLAVAGQGLMWVASSAVKPLFDRTIHGAHLSYPSGHTAGATAFALVVGFLVVGVLRPGRTAGIVAVLGVSLVCGLAAAWAQTVLAAHYATDTLGGFCLAVAVVPPLAVIVDRVADRLLAR